MSKTAKIIIGLIVLLLIIWGVSSSRGTKDTSVTSKEPVKIGFIGPLTGDASVYGETEKNALKLAVDEINSSQGIDGRSIEVIYEDGKCTGKDAASAAQKLINIDKVSIILGGACSSETLAIAPIAEDAHVIVLSSFSSNPQISTAGDYIFRNAPSDADVAKTDATYIASHFKNAGLISENTDYTQGVRSVMKEVLAKANVPVVADELFGGPGIAVDDFRTVLQGVKAKNPEVIYINAQTGKTGARILKQMRDLGIRIPVTSNLNLGGADAIAIAGSYTDGIVISDSTKLSDKGQSLLKKYKDTYNSDPINQFEMAASYDRAYIIAQAIKAVGTDATKIKDYLYSMKEYTGAVGTYHFDENGDVVGVGFANFVIKDGKEIPVIK